MSPARCEAAGGQRVTPAIHPGLTSAASPSAEPLPIPSEGRLLPQLKGMGRTIAITPLQARTSHPRARAPASQVLRTRVREAAEGHVEPREEGSLSRLQVSITPRQRAFSLTTETTVLYSRFPVSWHALTA